MSLGEIASIVGPIAVIITMLVGGVTLYVTLRRPIEKLETKIDAMSHELGEFRLDITTTVARHDERLSVIERDQPRLHLR